MIRNPLLKSMILPSQKGIHSKSKTFEKISEEPDDHGQPLSSQLHKTADSIVLDDQDYEELKRHQVVANPHSNPSHAAHHQSSDQLKLMSIQKASKPGDFAFLVDNTAILH